MRDENDFHVAVAGRDELVEQEEEATREILLHRVHRARGIHDANDGGVGLFLGVDFDVLVAQVVLVEREAALDALERGRSRGRESFVVEQAFDELAFIELVQFAVVGRDIAISLRRGERARGRIIALVGRQHAHYALLGGAALVEPDADADLAVAFAARRIVGLDFAQRAAFEVRQFEVLEHDLDQFLEGDVGLVVIDAGAIAGLLVAFAGAVLAGLADHLAGAGVAVALRGARRIVAVDEAIFLDSAERNLDHAVFIFADDRFFGNYVGDI